MRLSELKPEYCENIPADLEEGIIYISEKYNTATHLCACGCKGKSITPLQPYVQWTLVKEENGTVSLTPSIGNWSGENPYHAHYYITENKITWC